ncbi:hypothetical protein ACS0TY_016737 [Phlomoides rotata]
MIGGRFIWLARNAAVGNSTLIEALALRFGLQKSIERGIRPLLLESVCQNLILALNGWLEGGPQTMMIIENIMSMAHNLDGPAFIFSGRETNRAAHSLAHLGTNPSFVQLWDWEVSPCCNNDIVNDVRREPSLLMK